MRILVTVPDAAERLKLPVRTVYDWVTDGRITSISLGPRRTLVDLDEVDRLCELREARGGRLPRSDVDKRRSPH
jgi:excisionase family DNA binding protein